MKVLFAAVAVVLALSGCAGRVQEGPGYFDSIDEAAVALANSLAAQIPTGSSFVDVPVDEVVNETSAEMAISSVELQNRLTSALNQALPRLTFKPLSLSNIPDAGWIVLSSFRPVDVKGKPNAWYRLRTAIVEKDTGKRVAFAEAYLQVKAFDVTPIRYFDDSPMYNINDAAFRAKMKSIEGTGGQELGETLGLATKYAEAIAYYNERQFVTASDKFYEVLSVDPNHLGAFSGLYQSYWQRGLKKEAEQVFAMFAEASIDVGRISAKLLFMVGTTDFVPNPDMAEQYVVWQRGLAQAADARKKCLNVIGHASKTGAETFNEVLSLQRAERIASNMSQFVPALHGKLDAIGKGSSQTIVGIGTDDARDAIDRRVEFLVRTCP